MMGLATATGDEVEVVATGPDAEAARDAVVEAIQAGGPGPVQGVAAPPPAEPAPGTRRGAYQLGGVVASRGVAVGTAFHLRWQVPDLPEEGRGEALERGELERALREVAVDIEAAIAGARRRRSAQEATILEAHRSLIEDPELFGRAAGLVAAGKGAAHAWRIAVEEQCAVLEGSESALLAERVADLRDLERQVVAKLTGKAPAVPEAAGTRHPARGRPFAG